MAMQTASTRLQAFRWPAETRQQVARESPKAFALQLTASHSSASDISMNSIEQRRARAATFMDEHGFEVVHSNGQRISTNRFIDPSHLGPSEFSEIFIGKLPRDMFEDELLPYLHMTGGNIVKIRYMMDFSGTGRGFCFVKFASIYEAIQAVELLDEKMLRSNSDTPICAKISFDNKRLYFSNLPLHCTANKLRSALERAEVEGVTKVEMIPRQNCAPLNLPLFPHSKTLMPTPPYSFCGSYPQQQPQAHCYVYFDTHVSATKARRLLMPGEVRLLGRKITIDWAKSDYPPEVQHLMNRAALKKHHLMLLANQQHFMSIQQAPAQDNGNFGYWNYQA